MPDLLISLTLGVAWLTVFASIFEYTNNRAAVQLAVRKELARDQGAQRLLLAA